MLVTINGYFMLQQLKTRYISIYSLFHLTLFNYDNLVVEIESYN